MTRFGVLALLVALGTPAYAQSTATGADNGSMDVPNAMDIYDRAAPEAGAEDPILGDSSTELPKAPLEISGADGKLIPAFTLDPDGNGLIDDAESDAARQFAARRGSCDGLIVSTSSPEQIIAVEQAQAISLMLVCANPDGLESEKRAAIAANPTLMDRLANAGFGLGDVAGIVLDGEGRGTLYIAVS